MSKFSPKEMLDNIRAKANINDNDFEKSIAIKLNKSGKIKFQLLALNSDYLFKPRVQHFIPKTPDCDDTNEKIMVVTCQGDNCPICDAALAFKNSGVKLDDVNDAYKSKYPYPNLRSVFTQAEHFLVGARIMADNADDGNYLPKDAQIGSTQLIQLSKSALSSLMSAYEDFLDDYDGDVDDLPPLFGIFEDGAKSVKSFVVNCRIQTQPWSYSFTFNKGIETKIEDVDVEKLKVLEEDFPKPTDDYLEKAINRIKEIQNFFVGSNLTATKKDIKGQISDILDEEDSSFPFDTDDDDDFKL